MKFYKSVECIYFAELEHNNFYELLMEEGLVFFEAIKQLKSEYYLINFQELMKNKNIQNYFRDKVIIFDNMDDLKFGEV